MPENKNTQNKTKVHTEFAEQRSQHNQNAKNVLLQITKQNSDSSKNNSEKR